MNGIDLGVLEHAPHATLIRDIAARCAADTSIQAIWVGGSLAAGNGDVYSDIDFRIAVEPGNLERWIRPEWPRYLPLLPCGSLVMRFGEQALLHHMVLTDGTIIDFYVQDTTRHNPEPSLVILACRDAEFKARLEAFAQPAAAIVREIDAAVVGQFLVDYWIATHKQIKALGRNYDYSLFIGLYIERMALLRAWYMQAVGNDIDPRPTLHMLGILHQGLAGKLTAEQQEILGLPSRTAEETVVVIEAIRAEMAGVGRELARRHGVAYPHELEAVVRRAWEEHRPLLTRRT